MRESLIVQILHQEARMQARRKKNGDNIKTVIVIPEFMSDPPSFCLVYEVKNHITREPRYGFPAGTPKRDERPEAAARRELKEESDIESIVTKSHYIGKLQIAPESENGENMVAYIYHVKVPPGTPVVAGDEQLDVEIVTGEKIEELIHEGKMFRNHAAAWELFQGLVDH